MWQRNRNRSEKNDLVYNTKHQKREEYTRSVDARISTKIFDDKTSSRDLLTVDEMLNIKGSEISRIRSTSNIRPRMQPISNVTSGITSSSKAEHRTGLVLDITSEMRSGLKEVYGTSELSVEVNRMGLISNERLPVLNVKCNINQIAHRISEMEMYSKNPNRNIGNNNQDSSNDIENSANQKLVAIHVELPSPEENLDKIRYEEKSYILLDEDSLSNMQWNGKYLDSNNTKKRKILIRDCYNKIYRGIKENICKCRNRKKEFTNILGENITFIPQCCVLIYGNTAVGKTALCYFLSYMFCKDPQFNNYDIIICKDHAISNNQRCFIRYGQNKDGVIEKKFFERIIPVKRRATIVISDNVEIREDDFSEDDVIIMISSPNACNYKIFRNKRYPIQYNIPQIQEDELDNILDIIFNNRKLSKLAKEFGCNIRNAVEWKDSGGLEEMIKKHKPEKQNCYIPQEYDEDVFIYDTKNYDDIPTKLRFMSQNIEDYYLMNSEKESRSKIIKDYSCDLIGVDKKLKEPHRVVKLIKVKEDEKSYMIKDVVRINILDEDKRKDKKEENEKRENRKSIFIIVIINRG